MPVVENVQVALSEVLEVRDGPLGEAELWGLLFQTTHALQELFLTGHALKDGVPQCLVTPTSLQCMAMGHVIVNACTPSKIKGTKYWNQEMKDKKFESQDQELEKIYVFTLGQTMQHTAYYGVTNKYQKRLSPLLKTIFQAMSQTDVDLRMILSDIAQVCTLHAEKYMNGCTFSKVVMFLHHEVLGSLPENKILNQVEEDICMENEIMKSQCK